jgi:hypothetical protein
MKILITENQLKKIEFKFLDYLFEDIYEVESKDYTTHKFWKKGDEVILEYYDTRLIVLSSIWDNISNMFSLDYDETSELIKYWMNKRLGLDVEFISSLRGPMYHTDLE